MWEKKAGEVTETAVQGTLQSGREGELDSVGFPCSLGHGPPLFPLGTTSGFAHMRPSLESASPISQFEEGRRLGKGDTLQSFPPGARRATGSKEEEEPRGGNVRGGAPRGHEKGRGLLLSMAHTATGWHGRCGLWQRAQGWI